VVAPRRRGRDAVGLANHAVLHNDRLPFVFKASGSETQFTNGFDPSPRARKLFNFPKPETRARIMRDAESNLAARTWRAKVQAMPAKFDEFDVYRP
jgi:type I restriction enzyme R subunit